MSKTKSIVIIQGKNNTPSVKTNHWYNAQVARVPQIGLDEFKYGFPSDGLSIVSPKWWERSSEDANKNPDLDEGDIPYEQEVKSEEAVNDGADVDEKGLETANGESYADLRGTSLLSHLRKKAAKEGKEALKLGVYRGFDVSKVGVKERKLLRRVFKSSLPSNLKTGPSDS